MKLPGWNKKNIITAGVILMLTGILCDGLLTPVIRSIYIRYEIFSARYSLSSKEKSADNLLNKAANDGLQDVVKNAGTYYEEAKEAGIIFCAVNESRMVFWTDNSVFPDEVTGFANAFLVHLSNGYYVQKEIQKGVSAYVVLIPVKYNYDIQNDYLINYFALARNDRIDLSISEKKNEDGYNFANANDEFLFTVMPGKNFRNFGFWLWMFIAGFFICILFFNQFIIGYLRAVKLAQAAVIYAATLLLIIILWRWLRAPVSLFNTDLFNPSLYASSNLLRSLGDLLVFSVIITWSVWLFTKISYGVTKNTRWMHVKITAKLALLFSLCSYVQGIIRGLVFDSSISFDLGNIFGLNYFSLCGLTIIGFLFIAAILLTISIAEEVLSLSISRRMQVYMGAAAFLVSVMILFPVGHFLYLSSFFCAGLYVLVYFLRSRETILTDLRPAGYIAILCAIYTSVLLLFYNGEKQKEQQKILASELVSERDPLAELSFSEIYSDLQNDAYAKGFFYNPLISQQSLAKRIEQLYFSGYLSKYDVEVFTFSFTGMPFKGNPDRPLESFSPDFNSEYATRARGDYLFFTNTYTGLPAYLSRVEIKREGRIIGYIVIRFQQKTFYEESVYPELFLSGSSEYYRKLDEFSYAIYNKKKLVIQKGDFAFPSVLQPPFNKEKTQYTVSSLGYRHNIYNTAPDQQIIISDKQEGVLYYSANFSFILIFFGLFALAVISLNITLRNYVLYFKIGKSIREITDKLRWKNISFRSRILVTISLSITLALLLVGFITIRYISLRYNNDELTRLNKKARSIVAKLENSLKEKGPFGEMNDEERTMLIKNLSGVYQTDINIFDVGGNLLATSQPMIYQKKILEKKMNTEAWLAFNAAQESRVMQEEKIGGLNYLSAYLPVKNERNEIAAYLNLPFFAREKQLNEDISSFLVALINIYMFLFVLFLAISVVVSNTLTAPLSILRTHLRTTRLNASNELIEWENDDEIGKLIQEYNAMVSELEESVRRLSESEREGAWKEMAKQVAHEIKNPLTPMKLNMQQLQIAWKAKDPRIEEMFDKVTRLIVNQIDSLSQIATEFSNFAKMPHDVPERVAVNEILTMVSELFMNHDEAVIYLHLSESEYEVWIDRNQFQRALSNLIKNALQAIPADKKGRIEISTSLTANNEVLIKIKDNGNGISEDLREKIFIPNFSTKTSGMGLGLAIVKNIINGAGGDISFTTKEAEGTVFRITLSQYLPEA